MARISCMRVEQLPLDYWKRLSGSQCVGYGLWTSATSYIAPIPAQKHQYQGRMVYCWGLDIIQDTFGGMALESLECFWPIVIRSAVMESVLRKSCKSAVATVTGSMCLGNRSRHRGITRYLGCLPSSTKALKKGKCALSGVSFLALQ